MEKQDQVFIMRHGRPWMDKIDAWRFKQTIQRKADVSKAAAIRELVDKALQTFG